MMDQLLPAPPRPSSAGKLRWPLSNRTDCQGLIMPVPCVKTPSRVEKHDWDTASGYLAMLFNMVGHAVGDF